MCRSLAAAVVVALATLAAPLPAGQGQWLAGEGGSAESAAQAAEQAHRETGGRVLSVQERDGGWEVKVLTPSGEIRSVFISDGR
jgi:hypothetical protein